MKYILQEKKNRLGIISLNRPEKRNALNDEVVNELSWAFSNFENDDEVKIIILRAEGSVFSAGADLKYLQQLQSNSFEENLVDSNNLKALFVKIYTLKKIVIAEIQGHAIAGGCGLITVCDFAFATPEAKFGYTEVKIGFIPALVAVFLLRKLNETIAKELLLTANLITAEKATEIGLINGVVPAENLVQHCQSFAENLITTNSAASMGLTKQLISKVQGIPVEEALSEAASTNAWVRDSPDCRKGIAGFINGENITW